MVAHHSGAGLTVRSSAIDCAKQDGNQLPYYEPKAPENQQILINLLCFPQGQGISEIGIPIYFSYIFGR